MKVLGLVLLVFAGVEAQQKLDITILYESLCPDSLNFIKNQFYPAYKDIAQYVDVVFVPFGKSSSVTATGESFECQHGPAECLGNKLQSCSLYLLEDQDAQVEYVHCFMNVFMKNRRSRQQEFGQSCLERVGLQWENIKQCFESPMGVQLQLQAEAITQKTSPRFVPTIIYNGIFNQRAQDDSLTNFKGVACSYITQTYPDAC